ncbi:MarR family transcriptional regulator [Gluconacetobacter asukensis]|uniref:MarR family transcriptional regulator n=2 Tax=Gluconacetobacter asukensis TaxID=1017181 RepID=A0A7W4P4N4_9PROT|nr:MarR family transcriptional regulator [Gluconacetobacter asukensis]
MAAGRKKAAGQAVAPLPDYMLGEQIGHLLRKAYQRHTAIFQQTMGEDGLTAVQFAVMVTIHEAGTVALTRISQLTAIDLATLRGIVARLGERDLVVVEHNASDRRQRLASLTKQGEELVKRDLPLAARITELTLVPLDACERIAAIQVLKKLAGE